MRETEAKSSAAGNVVEGFSQRFNLVLDRARFPKQNRITVGAKRFDVVPNTFKAWCTADKIPGTHSDLLRITSELLREMPGRYNARAVVAWLLAGDAVPNPFGDDTDALLLVELYLKLSDIAKHEGMDFDKLPRNVRNLILKRVRALLPPNATSSDDGVELDETAVSVVIGMLETARTMEPTDRG
jgi:hypothetical protein